MPGGDFIKDPDDPQRCTAIAGTRQCNKRKMDGFDYCAYHNSGQLSKMRKEQQRQYLLTNWRQEIDHYANNDQIKSLREEIAISRLLMQQVLNKCTDAQDLILYSGKIMEIANVIKGLITTCHHMDEKTQFLVDKNQIVMLASQILDIISEHVENSDTMMAIAEQIQKAIEAKSTIIVEGKELVEHQS